MSVLFRQVFPELFKIFLAWNLLFNFQSDAAPKRCQNHHGDIGFCILKGLCGVSHGINIGSCPTNSFLEEVCCYSLPCSSLEQYLLSQRTTRRTKRAIVHENTPLKTIVDPVCGLRIEDEEPIGEQRNPMRLVFRFQFELEPTSSYKNFHKIKGVHVDKYM